MLGLMVLLPLAGLMYRVEAGAASAWSAGVQAESIGQLEDAVYEYQRSAKWNTLFSATSPSARTKLKQIAEEAEARGATDLAVVAQRYLRGVLLATNHIWRSGNGAEVTQINQTIARLTADIQMASGAVTIRGRSLETLAQDHLRLLERQNGPTPFEGVVVFILFVAWIGSVLWTIWNGLNAEGKIHRRALLRGSLVTVILFTGFCFMLSSV